MPSYIVKWNARVRGKTRVEAPSEERAIEMVESGDISSDDYEGPEEDIEAWDVELDEEPDDSDDPADADLPDGGPE